MKTIYISSTYQDLKAHREAVYLALHKMQYRVIAMEDYVAKDERTVGRCLADVTICDFYIGIFAKRYGYVPPLTDSPEGKSITELEYRKARDEKKYCLLFLLDPKADWPDGSREDDLTKMRLLENLRAELEPHSPVWFRTPSDLAENVMASVHVAESEVLVGALPAVLATDAVPSEQNPADGGPGQNAQPPLSPLYIGQSYLPVITSKIRAAISNVETTKVVAVDLGIGQSWWSTRLHLLAALLADYTEVEQIVFTVNGAYLGMCPPKDVRRVLSGVFPEVENAYRASLPKPAGPVFDLSLEIDSVVAQFAQAMDNLGGELNVKRWVAPHVVSNWRGFHSEKIEVTAQSSRLTLLREIMTRRLPFVAIVTNGALKHVIDRADLATRVAADTLR